MIEAGILIPDVKRHMEKTRLCVRCLCITSHRWLQRCRCMGLLETRKDACAVRVPGAAVPRDRRSVPSDPSHQIYASVNVLADRIYRTSMVDIAGETYLGPV